MKKDKVEKPYKLAVLRDRGGDLSKEWYIEFYAFDDRTKDLKRQRIKIPLMYTSDAMRRKFAAQEIADYNQLLRNGFYFKADPLEEAAAPVVEHMLITSLTKMLESSTYLRKKSIGTYRSAVNKLTVVLEREIPIAELTSSLIYRIRDRYLLDGNNAVTANKSIGHLGRLFREFTKRYDINLDPFKGIERLPETQLSTSNIAFTKEDQEKLEKYMIENHYPLYLFTRYMYYAFIRPRELRFLRVKHVQAKNLTITIPGEIAKNRKTETVAIITPLLKLVDLNGVPPNHYLFGAGLKTAKGQCSENSPLNWHTDALEACKRTWLHTLFLETYGCCKCLSLRSWNKTIASDAPA